MPTREECAHKLLKCAGYEVITDNGAKTIYNPVDDVRFAPTDNVSLELENLASLRNRSRITQAELERHGLIQGGATIYFKAGEVAEAASNYRAGEALPNLHV